MRSNTLGHQTKNYLTIVICLSNQQDLAQMGKKKKKQLFHTITNQLSSLMSNNASGH